VLKKTTSVRIDDSTHVAALKRAKGLGFRSWSEYVETLVRLDLDGNFTITLVRDPDGGARYVAGPGDNRAGEVVKSTPQSTTLPPSPVAFARCFQTDERQTNSDSCGDSTPFPKKANPPTH